MASKNEKRMFLRPRNIPAFVHNPLPKIASNILRREVCYTSLLNLVELQ